MQAAGASCLTGYYITVGIHYIMIGDLSEVYAIMLFEETRFSA